MAERQPAQQSRVGGVHGLDLAADNQLRSARQFLAAGVDDLLDVVGHAAQVAALHRAVRYR